MASKYSKQRSGASTLLIFSPAPSHRRLKAITGSLLPHLANSCELRLSQGRAAACDMAAGMSAQGTAWASCTKSSCLQHGSWPVCPGHCTSILHDEQLCCLVWPPS